MPLSIYHLMQHVLTFKSHHQAKILVIKQRISSHFFIEFRSQFYKSCLHDAV